MKLVFVSHPPFGCSPILPPRYLTRGLGKVCGIGTESGFPWPTCKVHYELLARHSDFYGWVWDAQYDPHGPVHIWLGGVMDCEASYARIIDLVGIKTGTNLAMLSFIHRKNLYREGVFKCAGPGEDVDNARGVDEGVGSKISLHPTFLGYKLLIIALCVGYLSLIHI